MQLWCCRRTFEPFGGIKRAANAARDGQAPDSIVEMTNQGGLMTTVPGYEAPRVRDLCLMYIAFDILYTNGQVRSLVLSPTTAVHVDDGLLEACGT